MRACQIKKWRLHLICILELAFVSSVNYRNVPRNFVRTRIDFELLHPNWKRGEIVVFRTRKRDATRNSNFGANWAGNEIGSLRGGDEEETFVNCLSENVKRGSVNFEIKGQGRTTTISTNVFSATAERPRLYSLWIEFIKGHLKSPDTIFDRQPKQRSRQRRDVTNRHLLAREFYPKKDNGKRKSCLHDGKNKRWNIKLGFENTEKLRGTFRSKRKVARNPN